MSLSVCIIALNEEKNIERCLKSAVPIADEIIVVDTGSSDGTVDIADKYADLVIVDKWRNDFSRARNISIDAATKGWILWLDADDEISKDSYDTLNYIKNNPVDCGFQFHIENIGEYDIKKVIYKSFPQFRMFPNRLPFRFTGRVHEQISESLVSNGYPIYDVPVTIYHHGYGDPELLETKMVRNHRLKMYEIGFPEHAVFYEFKVKDYFCYYYPNSLVVWDAMRVVAVRCPFDSDSDNKSINFMTDKCLECAKSIINDYENDSSVARMLDDINRIVGKTNQPLRVGGML